MRKRVGTALRLCSWGLLVVLGLAGCGGGTPPPPSSITLTVEDASSAFNAAAYQVGTGTWQLLTTSGTTTKTGTFNLGGQTKYGVAVRCSSLVVKVIQATASELPNPKVVCSSSAPSPVPFTVTVNVDSSLLAPGDFVCVNSFCQAAGASISVTTSLQPGNQDLLLTLKDSTGGVKVAKVLKNVNVTSGGSDTASLAPADQIPPVSLTLPTPPTGYSPITGALVSYLSAGGVMDQVNASATSYRPVSGFASGDRYAALVQTSSTNASLMSAQVFAGGAPTLSLPQAWGSGSLAVTQSPHPSVSGLSLTGTDLRGYRFYLQIPGQIYYTATVSKGWLGNAPGYTLPDLSANTLLGYTAPSGSGSFDITAFFSNKPLVSLDALDPSSFGAGDYIREATAGTNNYTVGGGTVNLP